MPRREPAKPRPGRPRGAASGARDGRTRISVYLTPELHARVRAIALAERRTVSTVALLAIERGLDAAPVSGDTVSR